LVLFNLRCFARRNDSYKQLLRCSQQLPLGPQSAAAFIAFTGGAVWHHEHRTSRVTHDAFGRAANKHSAQSGPAVRGGDDQVDTRFSDILAGSLHRRADDDLRLDLAAFSRNRFAQLVLKNGGQLVVVPRERMPTQSGSIMGCASSRRSRNAAVILSDHCGAPHEKSGGTRHHGTRILEFVCLAGAQTRIATQAHCSRGAERRCMYACY
jgi:hypothetical protein